MKEKEKASPNAAVEALDEALVWAEEEQKRVLVDRAAAHLDRNKAIWQVNICEDKLSLVENSILELKAALLKLGGKA